MDLNNINIIGRLTRDPELKFIPSGTACASFTIACQDKPVNGEKKASFFDVTAWGKVAESVSTYLKKGNLCAISGRFEQQT